MRTLIKQRKEQYLDAAIRKVERTKEQIAAFRAELEPYKQQRARHVISKQNPNLRGRTYIHRIRATYISLYDSGLAVANKEGFEQLKKGIKKSQ